MLDERKEYCTKWVSLHILFNIQFPYMYTYVATTKEHGIIYRFYLLFIDCLSTH